MDDWVGGTSSFRALRAKETNSYDRNSFPNWKLAHWSHWVVSLVDLVPSEKLTHSVCEGNGEV